MNKTVETIKKGQNVTTEELFEVVNAYTLTTLSLRKPDSNKDTVMSMMLGSKEFLETL